jgi:hypothetical protein
VPDAFEEGQDSQGTVDPVPDAFDEGQDSQGTVDPMPDAFDEGQDSQGTVDPLMMDFIFRHITELTDKMRRYHGWC